MFHDFALFPIHESHKVIKQINKAIHEMIRTKVESS